MALSSEVERTPEELNDALQNRMEMLVSNLMMIGGITKRGAALTDKYRAEDMPAIRRLATRIFDALEKGEPAVQPWDRSAA